MRKDNVILLFKGSMMIQLTIKKLLEVRNHLRIHLSLVVTRSIGKITQLRNPRCQQKKNLLTGKEPARILMTPHYMAVI